MDMLQLIRHYDCGFIGIPPSVKRVDSGFLNTDILDAKIKKISLTAAKIVDYFNNECYFLNDLPKTSILHSSKDFALFSMAKQLDPNKLQDCCKAAYWYSKTKSFPSAGKYFDPPKASEQVKTYDHKAFGAFDYTLHRHREGVRGSIKGRGKRVKAWTFTLYLQLKVKGV